MPSNNNRKDLNHVLSNRLLALRDLKNVTQATVATATGISRTSIVAYENGTSIPDLEKLYKLSEYYEVSCDYLLGKDIGTTHELNDICKKTGLTETSVKKLYKYVNDKNDNKYCAILAINKILESNSSDFLLTFSKYLSLPFDLTENDFNNNDIYYNLYCERYKVEIPTTMYCLSRESNYIEYASYNQVLYYELMKKFEELLNTIQDNPNEKKEYIHYIINALQSEYESEKWDEDHSQTQTE